ncbi:MAG: toll/interleukin-1 receptor domain-containing protein [Burkholderiaceae bacterium]
MPGTIFVSYRRDDAAGYARALGDRLARRYGADRVFVDVDDIVAGECFDAVIEGALSVADVALVLIGKRWRGEREGRPARIDDADDRVRHEVATALAGKARVIPVLLDGTSMPDWQSLPPPLQGLATRQAVELGNTRFEADMQRLLGAVDGAFTAGGFATSRAIDRRWLFAALAGAVLVTGSGAWWWLRRDGVPAVFTPEPASALTARLAVNGTWQAEVVYDWPNARYTERFEFGGDATSLHGSASFLGVARGLEEGRVDAGGMVFVTRTAEAMGETRRETLHRYAGRLVGDDELHFTMQTESASTPHAAVAFVARRVK